ncbi:MAG: biotin--[acetyl-CoA-carboxylase] ligase [Lachnospiraceae bacterium]|nr:biotin--[acetyl-CoA-carboxylase] ligase [Lachnospiraceae bacterium]
MNITHIYYDEIDSTNNEIKRQIEHNIKEGTVISAGTQTAGRGRSGHDWISPKNVSVATSMVLYPKSVKMEHVPRMTLLAAVAVAKAIESLYDLKTEIKWPNDILVHKKKICGILTEMEAEAGQVKYVVVGIGVNVHNREFTPELLDKATSLDLALEEEGKHILTHCKDVTKEIWNSFGEIYESFLETEDLTSILSFYNDRLVNKNRQVRVLNPLGEYEAVAKEMLPTGELLVDKSGEMIKIDSGEVSVRGIYGYV